MKTKRGILCGMGNVGKTFLGLLTERTEMLREQYGLDIQVCGIVDLGGAAIAEQGSLPLTAFLEHCKGGGSPENFPGYGIVGMTGVEAIQKYPFDILLETTPTNLTSGQPGKDFVEAAIAKGMDVVSADKGPFVLFYDKLNEMAKKSGSRLFLSAAVGAALPTLDVGKFSLPGAKVTMIEGILNGTTNFILTKMLQEQASYADALKEAQSMGIAEPNPSLDVEGFDTRNKLVLISNTILGTHFGLGDVPVKGITEVTYEEMLEATQEGKVLKLIATAEVKDGNITLSVAPKRIDKSHPLAAINFSEKGITYTTDTMGQITVFGGKSSPMGAAAALLKDVIHTQMFAR